jgi:uncharacterized membrane protein YbhN (UPF0104 family)
VTSRPDTSTLGAGWGRPLRLALLALLGLMTFHMALHFPWARAGAALLSTDRVLLGVALVVNLVSLAAKGWAWHRLLRVNTSARWDRVQRANLLGSAVSDVSISLVGEAARVRALAKEGLPLGLTAVSVAVVRLAEAVALAIVVACAVLLLPLSSPLARAGVAAAVMLATGVLVVSVLRRSPVVDRLRRRLPPQMVEGVRIVGRRPFGEAVGLGLVNWGAQWSTYALVFAATHVTSSPRAAFAALLAANLGGALRLTPANIGVFQASLVLGLVPFGVDPSSAVLAGLVLQAVQVPPVIGLASVVAGFDGLLKLRRQSTEPGDASGGVAPVTSDSRAPASRPALALQEAAES